MCHTRESEVETRRYELDIFCECVIDLEKVSILLSDRSAELDSEIGDLLEEFEAVVEEMSARGARERVLRQAKHRPAFSDGVTDSGIEDADDGECASPPRASL